MTVRPQIVLPAVLVAVCSLFHACGGGSPTAGNNPRPTATPTTAQPTGTPVPGLSCGLPVVTDANPHCVHESTTVYLSTVENAIVDLQNGEPSIFNGSAILDVGRYRLGVQRNLERLGCCAMWDGDEIGVKRDTNEFSEHFHIDTSSRIIHNGPTSYLLTCRPAAFPLSDDPLPQRGDCSLPSSISVGCSRVDAGGQFMELMDTIADEIARDRPDLVLDGIVGDYNNHIPYYNAVIERLLARGYCAVLDDTDVNVKNTNEFSEWYKVLVSDGRVRRGSDAYRGSCSPAAF